MLLVTCIIPGYITIYYQLWDDMYTSKWEEHCRITCMNIVWTYFLGYFSLLQLTPKISPPLVLLGAFAARCFGAAVRCTGAALVVREGAAARAPAVVCARAVGAAEAARLGLGRCVAGMMRAYSKSSQSSSSWSSPNYQKSSTNLSNHHPQLPSSTTGKLLLEPFGGLLFWPREKGFLPAICEEW